MLYFPKRFIYAGALDFKATDMTSRIPGVEPPYDADVQLALDTVMRGKPPLLLFKVLARDRRLFDKFFSGALLDRGHLTLRDREIVICRTTALCGSEYEWGVHIGAFGEKSGFTDEQVHALAFGDAPDGTWTHHETLLVRLCETLHAQCTLEEVLWQALRDRFSEEALLELLLLAGFYRGVSYLTNALDLPLEPDAPRFPLPA